MLFSFKMDDCIIFIKLKTRTSFGIVGGIHFLFFSNKHVFSLKIDLHEVANKSIFVLKINRKWIPSTIPNIVLVFSFVKVNF